MISEGRSFGEEAARFDAEAKMHTRSAAEWAHDSEAARTDAADAAHARSLSAKDRYYESLCGTYRLTADRVNGSPELRAAFDKAWNNHEALEELGPEKNGETEVRAGYRRRYLHHLEVAKQEITRLLGN